MDLVDLINSLCCNVLLIPNRFTIRFITFHPRLCGSTILTDDVGCGVCYAIFLYSRIMLFQTNPLYKYN